MPAMAAGARATRIYEDPRLTDHWQWALEHRPESATVARRLARVVLDRWRVEDTVVDDVLLVVSELLANAIAYARPPLALHLHRDRTGHDIWVGVTDGGAWDPADGMTASHRAPDEHGRGLTIVEALAMSHGCRHQVDGVIHWARLSDS